MGTCGMDVSRHSILNNASVLLLVPVYVPIAMAARIHAQTARLCIPGWCLL